MSAEIINLAGSGGVGGSDFSHPYRAENALRILQMLRAEIEQIKGQNLRPVRQARALCNVAIQEIERALESQVTNAEKCLSDVLFEALGRNITIGEVRGARRLAELLLSAIPKMPEQPREPRC